MLTTQSLPHTLSFSTSLRLLLRYRILPFAFNQRLPFLPSHSRFLHSPLAEHTYTAFRFPESFSALFLSRSIFFSRSPLSIIMSAVTCYKCGEAGHMSRSCPRVAATRSCYNCGETGHMSRDCPSERKPKSCYNCGSTEHLSRDCTNEAKAGADTRSCYNCGETGHMSRDCPNERKPKSCYNCGSTEHLSRECPDRH
ncbi:universal minicircle sequence binding protein [Leishmania tarentolae]|uniref:Universal minicircle sequence binding protein n=1 Tax=Leishmania tarentolae TaxID=5689 RepID=A0A640L0C2_LEITA|nr:universal minicircle sequence binding protein [Leishmania tarentolae]